jgi:hypothetical protein
VVLLEVVPRTNPPNLPSSNTQYEVHDLQTRLVEHDFILAHTTSSNTTLAIAIGSSARVQFYGGRRVV